MLLSMMHIVSVTNRNITKIRSVIPTARLGNVAMTSHQLIEIGVSRISLRFVCDECGSLYTRISCKYYEDNERGCYCPNCRKSKAQKTFYSTERGKELRRRITDEVMSRDNYHETRKMVAVKFKCWLKTEAGLEWSKNTPFMRGVQVKYGPENPRWNPDKKSYKEYRRMCMRYTQRNKKLYSKFENYDKIGKSGVPGAYQLDHIIPIKYGFDNNICPSVIGDITNLQIITWEHNRLKWDNYEV